ncbi:MAG: DegV family protein [Clostridiales bacterium]|nr:DegV family protein [Clostridiales bacterium]
MKDYALLMDVSGDILRDYVLDGKVRILPMEFIISGEVYTYTDDENGMSTDQFYQFVREKAPMSTTQITPAKWTEYFEHYLKAGVSVLCLCLSSGLSSSFNSACTAAEELKQKYPDMDVLPVDSMRATGVEGIICERMIENKEKGLSILENYADLMQFRSQTRACAYIDDIDTLKRGGRISKTVAFVGGLLGIKPLIQFMPDGTLSVWGKERGYKASTNKMVEYYLERADVEHPQTVYITHADEENYANELAAKIKAVSPLAEIKIRTLSPIIGVHLGTGGMVLGFVARPDAE